MGTFFFWARKPSGVAQPIVIHTRVSIDEILKEAGDAASQPYFDTPLDFVDGRQGWSWPKYWSCWMNILRRLGIIFAPRKRPINRVPNDTWPEVKKYRYMFLFHAAYAGINFAGWNLDFPSASERFLWRFFACLNLASIAVTWIVDRSIFWLWPRLQPVLRMEADEPSLPGNVATSELRKRKGCLDWLRNNSHNKDPSKEIALKALLPVSICGSIYIIARGYVLFEDLANLRALPPSAYEMVQWSLFIPHL